MSSRATMEIWEKQEAMRKIWKKQEKERERLKAKEEHPVKYYTGVIIGSTLTFAVILLGAYLIDALLIFIFSKCFGFAYDWRYPIPFLVLELLSLLVKAVNNKSKVN